MAVGRKYTQPRLAPLAEPAMVSGDWVIAASVPVAELLLNDSIPLRFFRDVMFKIFLRGMVPRFRYAGLFGRETRRVTRRVRRLGVRLDVRLLA